LNTVIVRGVGAVYTAVNVTSFAGIYTSSGFLVS